MCRKEYKDENSIFKLLDLWTSSYFVCCSGPCGPGEWGVREVGCEACLCSVLGSLGPACDPASGQCSCRPGYTGHKCNICPGGQAQKFGKTCDITYQSCGSGSDRTVIWIRIRNSKLYWGRRRKRPEKLPQFCEKIVDFLCR